MWKKILQKITHNIGLKALALVGAILLWMVVVNLDDPEISRSFTIVVNVTNPEFITNQGKVYEIIDGNNINFTVKAKRSDMEKLSNEDFKAVANLENVSMNKKENKGTVPIEITAVRYASLVKISQPEQEVSVSFEDLASGQFSLKTETYGELPEGYALGDISVAPNIIKISGPASVVSRIDHVVVPIDITGMTSKVVDNVVPVIYDAIGNVIDRTKLTMSLTTATVSVEILGIKDVGITVSYVGHPATGYVVSEIISKPEKVQIKGKPDALNLITNISVPASAVDVSGARTNVNQTIDVSAYLPDGVELTDAATSKVNVEVEIVEMKTRVMNMFTSDIDVINLEDDYEVSYNENYLMVTVYGEAAVVDKMTLGDITATIDASALKEGTNANTTVLVDTKVKDVEVHLPTLTVNYNKKIADLEENISGTVSDTTENGGSEVSGSDTGSENKDENSDSSVVENADADTEEE